MTIAASRPPVGAMLREWRRRRRLSQLELALKADVSSRHLKLSEKRKAGEDVADGGERALTDQQRVDP